MIVLFVVPIFLLTGIIIFLYLRASFRLLEDLQDNAPKVWEQLGKPERIYVRRASGGGIHTIKPLLPWIGWIFKGATTGLTEDLAKDFNKTRRLLIVGLVMFFLTVGCLLLLMAQEM